MNSPNIINTFLHLKKVLLFNKSNEESQKKALFEQFDQSGQVIGIDNIKWDAYKPKNPLKPFYPLWIADLDFSTPDFIQKALQNRVSIANYGYTETSSKFNEALIKWYFNCHNYLVKKEEIFRFSSKSLTGLGLIFEAFSKPGDSILLLTPIYHAFFYSIKSFGLKMIESPLIYKDRTFFIDFDNMERKIVENKPKIFLFCSPHNPVGRVWTVEEITKVSEICLKYNVLFISDEVYADWAFEGKKHTISGFAPFENNTILLFSLGKNFNLNGVETGYAIVKNPKHRQLLVKSGEKMSIFPSFGNIFSDVVMRTAFSEGKFWLDCMKQYTYENYLMMVEFFKENIPEIEPVVLEGCFVLLCDITKMGIPEQEFIAKCQEGNIIVIAGSAFHCDRPMFRINIGCSKHTLNGALKQMKEIFTK